MPCQMAKLFNLSTDTIFYICLTIWSLEKELTRWFLGSWSMLNNTVSRKMWVYNEPCPTFQLVLTSQLTLGKISSKSPEPEPGGGFRENVVDTKEKAMQSSGAVISSLALLDWGWQCAACTPSNERHWPLGPVNLCLGGCRPAIKPKHANDTAKISLIFIFVLIFYSELSYMNTTKYDHIHPPFPPPTLFSHTQYIKPNEVGQEVVPSLWAAIWQLSTTPCSKILQVKGEAILVSQYSFLLWKQIWDSNVCETIFQIKVIHSIYSLKYCIKFSWLEKHSWHKQHSTLQGFIYFPSLLAAVIYTFLISFTLDQNIQINLLSLRI